MCVCVLKKRTKERGRERHEKEKSFHSQAKHLKRVKEVAHKENVNTHTHTYTQTHTHTQTESVCVEGERTYGAASTFFQSKELRWVHCSREERPSENLAVHSFLRFLAHFKSDSSNLRFNYKYIY